MLMSYFVEILTTIMSYIRKHAMSPISVNERDNDTFNIDRSTFLMRLISSIMLNVQQTNLNAKHMQTRQLSNSVASDRLHWGYCTKHIYINFNRSCSQRQTLEIAFAVDLTRFSALEFERFVQTLRQHFSYMKPICATRQHVRLYGLTTKKKWCVVLSKLSRQQRPKLIFVSSKSQTWHTETTKRHKALGFIANFILYHTFHEFERPFDFTATKDGK